MSDLPSEPARTGASGCLIRLVWMIGGPLALVLCALAMVRREAVAVSWLDAAYPVVLGLTLAARRADATTYAGLTADGEITTSSDLRRWSLTAVAVALVGWAGGHVLAFAVN